MLIAPAVGVVGFALGLASSLSAFMNTNAINRLTEDQDDICTAVRATVNY